MTDPVILRPYVPSDEDFVYASWLRDLRAADPSGLPDDLWFPAHRAFIDRALADRSVAVVMAAAADAPTEILGFAVARPKDELLWVTIKKPLREKGLARRLLAAVQVEPGTPARWLTPLAKSRLQLQLRSRQLRSPKRETPPRSSEALSRSSTR